MITMGIVFNSIVIVMKVIKMIFKDSHRVISVAM